MAQVVSRQYCLQCGQKIYSPVITLGPESKFCEECEIGDYEGKCSCLGEISGIEEEKSYGRFTTKSLGNI